MDRNLYYGDGLTFADGSLSARRAWIEMQISVTIVVGVLVALRKESVDRNATFRLIRLLRVLSLSARRAWIEMDWASVITAMTSRRSPQGERG